MSPPVIFLKPVDPSYNYGEDEAKEDREWLWTKYCAVVWDSLAKGAARDISSFKFICEKLWRPFVQPVTEGTFGTRDFSRLLVFNRALLQGEDAFSSNLGSKVPSVDGKILSKGCILSLALLLF
jgi:origin recognition complex subunit 5